MTEQEKIEALKANEKPFGLMDKELQDRATEIGIHNFRIFGIPPINGVLPEWLQLRPFPQDIFRSERTYQLDPCYKFVPAEPDEIEFAVTDDDYDIYLIAPPRKDLNTYPCKIIYTHAPAVIPMSGYRFAGYRYKNLPFDMSWQPVVVNANQTIIFPVAAVYRKEVRG